MKNDILTLKTNRHKYRIYIHNLDNKRIAHNKAESYKLGHIGFVMKKKILIGFLKRNNLLYQYMRKCKSSYVFYDDIPYYYITNNFNLSLSSFLPDICTANVYYNWIKLLESINAIRLK